MRKLTSTAILFLALCALSGCGTLGREETKAQLFPALHYDISYYGMSLYMVKEGFEEDNREGGLEVFMAIVLFVSMTIDLPISLVTDTLMFPHDLLRTPEVPPAEGTVGGPLTWLAQPAEPAGG